MKIDKKMNVILDASYSYQSAFKVCDLLPYKAIHIIPHQQRYGHATLFGAEHYMVICCNFTHDAKVAIYTDNIVPPGLIFSIVSSPRTRPVGLRTGFSDNRLTSGGPLHS